MVRAYIDDILVMTKILFKDHLNLSEKFLLRLFGAGLKVNAENSLFGRTEIEYVGFWERNNGTIPLSSKIESI